MSTEENIVSEPAPAPAPEPAPEEAPAPAPAPEEAPISTYSLELINPAPPPPPAPISLDDLLATNQMLLKKEAEDKAILEAMGNTSHETLKSKLIVWATAGFPNVYEIDRLSITPPTLCSDGISRDLASYIQFCSGKPIQDHISPLQAKVTGIAISFANMGGYISIVVTKAQSS